MPMKKSILVTGSHRSGSTWTGKVVSKATNVRYIHEPFNVALKRKFTPFENLFESLQDAPPEKQKIAKDYLNSFYKIFHANNLKALKEIKSLKGFYYYLLDLKDRQVSEKVVVKDPIAVLSSEWLYLNYDMDVVVVLRHPAAFVASIKVKNWEFDFQNLKNQDHLMKGYLKNYQNEIEDSITQKKDIIGQGILIWSILYDVVAQFKDKYGDKWYFVKHEDLSTNPYEEFQKMFDWLDIKFNANVENFLKATTEGEGNSTMQRNSKENTKTWKKRLSEQEIERIKSGTEKVWTKFYTEEDW